MNPLSLMNGGGGYSLGSSDKNDTAQTNNTNTKGSTLGFMADSGVFFAKKPTSNMQFMVGAATVAVVAVVYLKARRSK